jgi:hypothetical protein
MMGVSEHGMLDRVIRVLIFSKRPSKDGGKENALDIIINIT